MLLMRKKGVKQVLIHGKDEKRAFTAVLSGSCKGKVLPIQSVWKGATSVSLPTKIRITGSLRRWPSV